MKYNHPVRQFSRRHLTFFSPCNYLIPFRITRLVPVLTLCIQNACLARNIKPSPSVWLRPSAASGPCPAGGRPVGDTAPHTCPAPGPSPLRHLVEAALEALCFTTNSSLGDLFVFVFTGGLFFSQVLHDFADI